VRMNGASGLVFALVLVGTAVSGCLGGEQPDLHLDAESMIVQVVEEGIADGTMLDLEGIVVKEEKFEMRLREETGDILANASFGYDRTTNTSKIGLIYASPYESISFTIIEGGEQYAIEMDGVWAVGRDLAPSFHDPFNFDAVQVDDSSLQMPEAELPVDVDDLRSLEWSITHDLTSGQSIAMADNETATIILGFRTTGLAPELVSIEAYGAHDAYTRSVHLLRGDEVDLTFADDLPRLPVPLLLNRSSGTAANGTVWQRAEFEGAFRWEVSPADLELRIGETDANGTFQTFGSLHLVNGSTDWLDEAGEEWWANWTDADADGLVSAGDRYEVGTTSNQTFGIAVHDDWAGAYATDMLPSAGVAPVLLAALVMALRRSGTRDRRTPARPRRTT